MPSIRPRIGEISPTDGQIGMPVAPSRTANSLLEGKEYDQEIGIPLVIRPSFTLGGTGGGFVHTKDELDAALERGLTASPIHEVLVEKAVVGWKEFELELLRDKNDNVVIICTVENVDPMGVHTGDSITVAPAMTLSDTAFHAAEGDPANLKLCQRGEWEERMLVETVLSMLTLVCHFKKVMHRVWEYFQARLAFTMAAFNVLVQWHGFQPSVSGFVPLSIAEFSL